MIFINLNECYNQCYYPVLESSFIKLITYVYHAINQDIMNEFLC